MFFQVLNSNCWLLERINFSVLNLYPAILIYLLISSRSFSVDSLRLSIDHHVFREQGKFYFFLTNLYTFSFLFSSFIAPARISRMKLNRRVKRGYICFVLNLRSKASSLSPIGVMVAVGFFLVICYPVLGSSLPILLRVIIMKECWVFFSCFFWISWYYLWFFFFRLLMS